jgi:3',5'-nucleoside bisphosphate phosphatase
VAHCAPLIDLHAHTTASDGQFSPRDLVLRARAAGVTTLAVTDHDTVAGVAEAVATARALGGIEIVPGIEVSTSIGATDIHVLGHFVRIDDPALVAFTAQQEGERRARMERMVAKLNELGISVTMAEVEAQAGSDNLCRPHLARVLVARGICGDMQGAFTRFIGDDGPAFSPHRHPDAREAIALIHTAGGKATLAHPAPDKVERGQIVELAGYGLDGVEIFRPETPTDVREGYHAIALDLGLAVTGGSDFHGEGNALGSIGLERRYYEALLARVTA